jgi:hypothetical protein
VITFLETNKMPGGSPLILFLQKVFWAIGVSHIILTRHNWPPEVPLLTYSASAGVEVYNSLNHSTFSRLLDRLDHLHWRFPASIASVGSQEAPSHHWILDYLLVYSLDYTLTFLWKRLVRYPTSLMSYLDALKLLDRSDSYANLTSITKIII